MTHNYYQQPGGEDAVFEAETRLLRSHGHDVRTEVFHNDTIPLERSAMESVRLARATLWSSSSRKRIEAVLRDFRPDIAHFHNTFPLVSPSVYSACQAEGVPVVQTLHNYRALCANALLFREGRVCEDCLNRRVGWPSIVHGCYRESRAQTSVVATLIAMRRFTGAWSERVSVCVAVSEFARETFIRGGLDPEKIVSKPNFLEPDPGYRDGRGDYAIYVGRLSKEKGVDTLLSAWRSVPTSIPLHVYGDGPLAKSVSEASDKLQNIQWHGRQPLDVVLEALGRAACLIFPSIWYEGMPRTLVESFAVGTPVIASKIGSLIEIVEPGVNGFTVPPGDAESLARTVIDGWYGDRRMHSLRGSTRALFEDRYSAEQNYRRLLNIYHLARLRARRSSEGL